MSWENKTIINNIIIISTKKKPLVVINTNSQNCQSVTLGAICIDAN